ncbi:hypothetical protein QMO40_09360 [Mannheimia bovis]|uniref:hypothetical protein n=1 Tax=Mannheimia TaxID=75984 RepID=UPI0024B81A62|nr:hypothetical protein [Mannheimia bovis]WHP46820.1 hypothetical protein QMO40_09360 [Mannheimia bovis]
MWNLFKTPIEKGSFESWAKISDDIAKVAILAIPVILYGNDATSAKVFNITMLIIFTYFFLSGGRLFRRQLEEMK